MLSIFRLLRIKISSPMELAVKETRELKGVVKAPPSKSYTHRAIIVSGLASGVSRISDALLSADPLASVDAVRAAGAKVEFDDGDGHGAREGDLLITGNGGRVKAPAREVDVKNSGTTIRIMSSVFSLCDRRVRLTGDESIQKRPMGPLLNTLEQLGVETASMNGRPPLTVDGPLQPGKCSIPGDVSSQFISGLLITLPLLDGDSTLEITTELKSKPYIDLTLQMMRRFGVDVENRGYRDFVIKGNQKYKAGDYTVEGDYSGAAFLLAAAALTKSHVTVENLFLDSKQGDKKIVDILKAMGAEVKVGQDSVQVFGSGAAGSLDGIDVDLSQAPDLLPIMAVLGAAAKGRTTIYNVEHARFKECDRITAMALGLKDMGVDVEERQDGLVIRGGKPLKGARIKTFKDHRIIMAFAVAGMLADGETIIEDAEHVDVSFPKFVEAMKGLGVEFS